MSELEDQYETSAVEGAVSKVEAAAYAQRDRETPRDAIRGVRMANSDLNRTELIRAQNRAQEHVRDRIRNVYS